MKSSRIGKTALIAAAVTLTASLSVGSALAYFTTYCTAEGSYTLDMGFPETDIDEDVYENGKNITITNTGKYDCYVRVMVYAPDNIMKQVEAEEGWTKGEETDDYWYYTEVLSPKETTSMIRFMYELPKPGDGTAPDTRPEDINIVVVHECVPVLYDEAGIPDRDKSWNNTASIITGETTTEPDTGTETEPGTGGDEEPTTGQEGE